MLDEKAAVKRLQCGWVNEVEQTESIVFEVSSLKMRMGRKGVGKGGNDDFYKLQILCFVCPP